MSSRRLRREVELPRPRLERLLVAWALANVLLVVSLCGGLVAIRASGAGPAADRAELARQQELRETELRLQRDIELRADEAALRDPSEGRCRW